MPQIGKGQTGLRSGRGDPFTPSKPFQSKYFGFFVLKREHDIDDNSLERCDVGVPFRDDSRLLKALIFLWFTLDLVAFCALH